jgi:glucose-1-phosphate thymidylyltransferase
LKGIILAGGTGKRLYPLTRAISKQLLPVFDKPMIYYPLSLLMLAGIREVLIISTPHDLPRFEELLEDGTRLGMSFSYAPQKEPRGIAEAYLIGRDFVGDDSVCLILGDNLFYGHGLRDVLKKSAALREGGIIFGYAVRNPGRYGVLEFDGNGNVVGIEEKPPEPKSRYAVTGIYFYDNNVLDIVSRIAPSGRGELEITDINREYLRNRNLTVELLGRGFSWLDMGTYESLQQASQYVQTIQERQGLKIACIEEIAYREGFIDRARLEKTAREMSMTEYGSYLHEILNQG